MTKIIILSLLVAIALIFIATPKISFKPLGITFVNGWFALGVMLIGFGVGLIRYQGYKQGVRVHNAFEVLKGIIKEEKTNS